MTDIEGKVDRLLHDAEHADSGARMASLVKDTAAAKELRDKRDRLVNEALALDPFKKCEAWAETSLLQGSRGYLMSEPSIRYPVTDDEVESLRWPSVTTMRGITAEEYSELRAEPDVLIGEIKSELNRLREDNERLKRELDQQWDARIEAQEKADYWREGHKAASLRAAKIQDEYESRLREEDADRARLDWLDAKGESFTATSGKMRGWLIHGYEPITLREAIDSARALEADQ